MRVKDDVVKAPQVSQISLSKDDDSSSELVKMHDNVHYGKISAPQISEISSRTNQIQQLSKESNDNQIVPRINFNGLNQNKLKKGALSSSISNLSLREMAEIKENFEGIMSEKAEINMTEGNANISDEDKDGGTSNTFDIDELRDVVRDNFMPNMGQSRETNISEDGEEEKIDNLIICKIENEFGYPEQYIMNCLQTGTKNDATTCYYLFRKEDKHEIVNLLGDSPSPMNQQSIMINEPQE